MHQEKNINRGKCIPWLYCRRDLLCDHELSAGYEYQQKLFLTGLIIIVE